MSQGHSFQNCHYGQPCLDHHQEQNRTLMYLFKWTCLVFVLHLISCHVWKKFGITILLYITVKYIYLSSRFPIFIDSTATTIQNYHQLLPQSLGIFWGKIYSAVVEYIWTCDKKRFKTLRRVVKSTIFSKRSQNKQLRTMSRIAPLGSDLNVSDSSLCKIVEKWILNRSVGKWNNASEAKQPSTIRRLQWKSTAAQQQPTANWNRMFNFPVII